MTKLRNLAVAVCCLLTVASCQKDTPGTEENILDERLTAALQNAGGAQGADFFKMPDSDDYANIPQDPRNPLTKEKTELGQMLFHETGLALAPKHEFAAGTYSCASCHFAEAGFQAGRVQGLGDGGIGIGIKGEGRSRSIVYRNDEPDAQPFRSPTVLHVAYQKNMLWNGQFGATAMNRPKFNTSPSTAPAKKFGKRLGILPQNHARARRKLKRCGADFAATSTRNTAANATTKTSHIWKRCCMKSPARPVTAAD